MPANENFEGEQLRLARLAHGFTLDELGERGSATRQYLNQLEQGTVWIENSNFRPYLFLIFRSKARSI